MQQLDLPVMRSLEDYRQEQLLDQSEFAAWLGITEQTYRRLLSTPGSVRMKTKRQIRERLGVSPYLVKELYPPPSPTMLAQIRADIEEADREGWVVVDPETLEPTGEIVDRTGRPMA